MLGAAAGLKGKIDLVIPVPLHPRRLAERGYNQAALLAAPVTRSLEVGMSARALVRVRDTPRQASLDRAARLINVRHAFVARASLVTGRRVLLIDDVRTTGATLDGAVRALDDAGAREVTALVLARRSPGNGASEEARGDNRGYHPKKH
jgi:ComF family protein